MHNSNDKQLGVIDKYFWVANILFSIIGISLIIIAMGEAIIMSSTFELLALKDRWIDSQEDIVRRMITYDLGKDSKNRYLTTKDFNELATISLGIEEIISGKKEETLLNKQYLKEHSDIANISNVMKDLTGYIQYSPSFKDALKAKRESDQIIEELYKIFKEHKSSLGRVESEYQFQVQKKYQKLSTLNLNINKALDDSLAWIKKSFFLIIISSGVVLFIAGAGTSYLFYKKLKTWQKSLQKALDEKKILIQEIHHRVKNNLAQTAGLLYLQQERFPKDSLAHQAIVGSKNRIQSMALIHELLYEGRDLSTINLQEYVEKLSEQIKDALGTEDELVQFYYEIEEIFLEPDKVVPIGLILNETITNSIKHGFSKREKGEIEITITKHFGNHLCLQVKDNGNGIPKDQKPLKSSSTLGFKLIRVLTLQLDGEVEIHSSEHDGTSIKVYFPLNR
ncbi:sensor histidine kinase [Fodinibius sediminis]|uniref:histidine kinase n=1 Tax=Fodinibius sediminis TaxID=1214077 RepID=A0A521EXU2_9BACT|nr:sensor histidine kinase [Fodinibius sediminis]SMO88703.1 Two-component sensor histidine kinase, contains HisKA and HATPase domains [Fodinibius sediminis]